MSKNSVVFDGKKYELPKIGGLSDLVAAERFFQRPITIMKDTAPMEYTAYLIWRGLLKLGVITKDATPFDDDFIDQVEDMEFEEEEDSENPTPEATEAPVAS
jgi:hypothetical protein